MSGLARTRSVLIHKLNGLLKARNAGFSNDKRIRELQHLLSQLDGKAPEPTHKINKGDLQKELSSLVDQYGASSHSVLSKRLNALKILSSIGYNVQQQSDELQQLLSLLSKKRSNPETKH